MARSAIEPSTRAVRRTRSTRGDAMADGKNKLKVVKRTLSSRELHLERKVNRLTDDRADLLDKLSARMTREARLADLLEDVLEAWLSIEEGASVPEALNLLDWSDITEAIVAAKAGGK